MSSVRIRPRSAFVDPALARETLADLPASAPTRRLQTPRSFVRAIASLRRPIEPERVIVLKLATASARGRR